MSAHRYWRVWFGNSYASDATVIQFAELEMRTSSGGSNVVTGGTALSSGDYSGSYAKGYAFDGTITPGYTWASTVDSQNAVWLGYDFGSGNDKDIVEIVLKTNSASGGTVTSTNGFPSYGLFQYSDDGTAWITKAPFLGASTPGWAYVLVIDVTPITFIGYNFAPHTAFYNRTVNAAVSGYAVGQPERLWTGAPKDWTFGKRHKVRTNYTGNFYISGSTTSITLPVSRRVNLIDQKSGLLVDSRVTLDDGVFIFPDITEGPWTVLGVDETAQQNDVVFAHVTAYPQ